MEETRQSRRQGADPWRAACQCSSREDSPSALARPYPASGLPQGRPGYLAGVTVSGPAWPPIQEPGVTTGEQLHRATGIASNPGCGACAGAGAGRAGPVARPGAVLSAVVAAALSSASRRLDGSRTIARMKPSPSNAAEMAKARV